MTNYNLEKHDGFYLLSKFIKSINGNRFKDFLTEIKTASIEISDNYKNYSNYGFNPYSDKYLNNEIILKQDIANKVKGDMLEIFCAYFLQYFESDIVFGITKGTYEFNNDETDIGCDGCGIIKTNNNKAFIQVKYRDNPTAVPFNKDVFCSLFTDATLNFGLDYTNSNQRLIFFTNLNFGKKGEWKARTGKFEEMSFNKCKVPVILIGKNEIEALVDGNNGFWTELANI